MALAAGLGFRPALAAPGRSSGFTVCYPLRKPALRRLAAADPPAPPPPPPPAGEPQPPIQLQGTVQAAPGAEQRWDFNPTLWQAKLFAIGACLLSAACAVQRGAPHSAMFHMFMVLVFLMPPWSEFDEAPLPPVPASQPMPPPPSQPANQLPIQQGTATQAAPGAKQGWRFKLRLWHVKLFTMGVCLLSADLAFRRGFPRSAFVHLFMVVAMLMPPW